MLLSGFTIGVRKEGRIDYLYDGTYIVFGTFRRWHSGDLALYSNIDVLYGVPGIRFNRTWEKERDEFGLLSYTKIYLSRNSLLVAHPAVSLTLRKKVSRFNIDGVVGVRLMRFGAIKSDFQDSGTNETKLLPIPTLAIKAGFHF